MSILPILSIFQVFPTVHFYSSKILKDFYWRPMGLKFTPTNFLFLEADSRKKDIVIIWTPKKCNRNDYFSFMHSRISHLLDRLRSSRLIVAHSGWKSLKKSHSTLRAKRAMFTIWVAKSSLKMPKFEIQMRHFGWFSNTVRAELYSK